METTFRIILQGRVQGVGFRPFVYREAAARGLRGWVSNNEEGVIIHATGPKATLEEFYHSLVGSPPPVSRVVNHYFEEISGEAPMEFQIVPSSRKERLNLQLTPDFALCTECRKEMLSPGNRRYQYPFISCVNCGPRWSLTEHFPFERENTSMEVFKMCPECLEEYRNPADRRFHSQTNSCATCGIAYWIAEPGGNVLNATDGSPFAKLAALLGEGHIIALKNTSGYLLCCDGRNEKVIRLLRHRKQRPTKPFAVLYPSMEKLKEDLKVSPREVAKLQSVERPIVLLSSKNYKGEACLHPIAPGLDQIGVMLPYTGILALLSEAFPHPLIATSGNIHGSPICFDPSDARTKLAGVADYFFEHSLKIVRPQDDSVIRFCTEATNPIILRRSRGMAPNYTRMLHKGAGSGLLALGAQLKSSIGFIPNDFLYVSEYLGNLENFEVFERFTRTVANFVNLFDQAPKALLIDSHPAYLSSLYGKELAQKWEIPVYSIPHHEAHFAAVLGEHQLFGQEKPVLGVIWDGTGYGEDGQIWGGEFFTYSEGKIRRTGHVEYYDWLAGDKMARESRLALNSLLERPDKAVRKKFTEEEWQLYRQLKAKNSLKTSSMGRLFDAVSSLLGLCDRNTFEGEAAMLLETASGGFELEQAVSLVSLDPEGNIPARSLVREVHQSLKKGKPVAQAGGDFIFTLVSLIFEKAASESIHRIAFSGGVFQNALLVEMLHRCKPENVKLYFHREFSPNDENIAFGQLMHHLNLIK